MGRFDHITPSQRKVSNVEKQNQASGEWRHDMLNSPSPSSSSEPVLKAPSIQSPRMLPAHQTVGNPTVGENLFLVNSFPIKQNDNPFIKGLKAVGNFATSTFSAPGEMLRKISLQGGNLLSGQGIKPLPKNTSFTEDILPQGAKNAVNNFTQKHPILGSVAQMGIETLADPTAYIGEKAIANLITPKSEIGLLKPQLPLPAKNSGVIKEVPLTPPQVELPKEPVPKPKVVAASVEKPKPAILDITLNPEVAATTDGSTAKVLEPIAQPKPSEMGNLPGKNEPLGNGQKARSFGITTVDSPMTHLETKAGVAEQIKPEGQGAYDPITLKGVDEEAQRLVGEDTEKAVAMILNEKEPSALHTATGIRLIEHFQKQGNYERAVDVSMQLADRLTKAGQEISAARIMSNLSPEGILTFASRQIKRINDSKWVKAGKHAEIDPEAAKQLDELARKLQETIDPNMRIELSQQIQGVLNDLTPSSWLKKLSSAQTISQLLNPKTQVRNIIGNEIFYRLERLNKYVATPIDFARSVITGSERTVTFRTGGQSGYWEGFFKGVKAGWKGVNVNGLATQFELGHGPAFKVSGNIAEKTMAYLEKTLGAVMKGFDNAAYTRAYNQTLGELATLRAINTAGKADKALAQKFMQESSDHLMDIADQYGKYVTFQDKNVLSNGLSAIKRGMNFGKEFGAGDFILKYPKTPGAIIMRALDYSPAGFLRSAGELAKVKGWIKGTPDPRQATMALSRAIIGTAGLTGMGYFLADKGLITGSGVKDFDAQEMQRQTGEGQYKVNISGIGRFIASGFNPKSATMKLGDTLVTYDWAQPVAMALSLGANVEQNIVDKANTGQALSNVSSTVVNGLEGSINTIAEQPVLQGLTKALRGVSRGDATGIGSTLKEAAKGVPSSFAPTLFNQVRQFTDNTGRSTYDPSWLREAGKKAQVKIPGLSKRFPIAYDTLGRPKENFQDGSNNIANVFLNPSFISKYNPTPEAKLALDLLKDTGENKQIPRIAPKSFVISGKRFELTPQEYSDLQRIIGEEAQRGLAGYANGAKPVSEMTQAEKDAMIKNMVDVLDKAGKAGREAILKAREVQFKKSGTGLKLIE